MPTRRRRHERPTPRRCPVCRRPVAARRRGRPPVYCSHPCRQVAYRQRKGQQHRRKLIELVQADVRTWLPALPDQSVDLIVTDPPYAFDRGSTYFRDWFLELPDEAWPAILAQLHRVLREDAHAYVFCDRRTQLIFERAAHAAGFRVHPPLIWNKGSVGLGNSCWRPQHELILFLEKGHRPGNTRTPGDVLTAPRVARRYPTEKPVPILRQLIEQASHPGELVLDPFCGSGNTGKAARALNRRALLCDVNATFAARQLHVAISQHRTPG